MASTRKLFFFKLIYIFFILLICIGGLTLLIRQMFPSVATLERGDDPTLTSQFGHSIDPNSKLLRFSITPYTGFQSPGNVSEEGTFVNVRYKFKTNNYGFLTKYDVFPFSNVPLKNSPNDRLVILTGGSAAWGWGASSNEKTYAVILENLLNQKDPAHKWIVLNLAMGTWIAYQEFLALDMYASNLKPDWVITFDGRNDIMVPTLHGEGVPNYYFFGGQKKLHALFDASSLTNLEKRFPMLRYKQLTKKINEMAIPTAPILDIAEIKKAADFYMHSTKKILQSFSQSKFILVTQPSSFYFAPGDSVLKFGYNLIIPQLHDLAKNNKNVRHINGSEWFKENTSEYLVDDCHLSDKGHNFVANKLVNLILDAGR